MGTGSSLEELGISPNCLGGAGALSGEMMSLHEICEGSINLGKEMPSLDVGEL